MFDAVSWEKFGSEVRVLPPRKLPAFFSFLGTFFSQRRPAMSYRWTDCPSIRLALEVDLFDAVSWAKFGSEVLPGRHLPASPFPVQNLRKDGGPYMLTGLLYSLSIRPALEKDLFDPVSWAKFGSEVHPVHARPKH